MPAAKPDGLADMIKGAKPAEVELEDGITRSQEPAGEALAVKDTVEDRVLVIATTASPLKTSLKKTELGEAFKTGSVVTVSETGSSWEGRSGVLMSMFPLYVPAASPDGSIVRKS